VIVPRIVGHYAIFDELAHGGMASVHLGRLRGAGGFTRTVAIKRLHEPFARDPEFVSMLLDEARLAARIRHPNVVPVLDVVACDGELSLVMEYVAGETLSRLIVASARQGGQIPVPITAAIVIGALTGLHAAHDAVSERGEPLHIVHRDVSPQNVIVGVDGVTRVFDFGIAKAAQRVVTTHDGALKGKIGYMSPEYLRGEKVDRRSDVYAAGVLLWEALVGERLFVGSEGQPLLLLNLEKSVEAPGSRVTGLSAALDQVVLRALDRDPARRFASAHDMAAALEACVQPASFAHVAAWMRSIAGPALAARAELVRRVESAEDLPPLLSTGEQKITGDEPIEVDDNPSFEDAAVLPLTAADTTLAAESPAPPVSETASRWAGRISPWTGIAALIVVGTVVAWAATLRSAGQSIQRVLDVPFGALFPTSPEVVPAVPALEPSSPRAASSAVAASASGVPAATAAKAPSRTAVPGAPQDCNPPFALDSNGHKRYKKHCFK